MNDFIFDKDTLENQLATYTANLVKNGIVISFTEHACKIIDSELQKNALNYLNYGLYWYALKKVLSANGYNYSDDDTEYFQQDIIDVYNCDSDDLTIVASQLFYGEVVPQYVRHNNCYQTANGNMCISDPDMEDRIMD